MDGFQSWLSKAMSINSRSLGQSQSKAPQIGFSFIESFPQRETESVFIDSYIPLACRRPEKQEMIV